jgi:hypothetical protein
MLLGLCRSRPSLRAKILTLRHQLNVLRRTSPQRPVFSNFGPYDLCLLVSDREAHFGRPNDVIVFGERHLLNVLRSYQQYYNGTRTSRMAKDSPLKRCVEAMRSIRPLPILGGLHHRYVRICFRQRQVPATPPMHQTRYVRTVSRGRLAGISMARPALSSLLETETIEPKQQTRTHRTSPRWPDRG